MKKEKNVNATAVSSLLLSSFNIDECLLMSMG